MNVKGMRIRKMGTRNGQPHYGVDCKCCPQTYGRENVIAVGHLSRDAAESLAKSHIEGHSR